MSEGFYKRRRGILEHLEAGTINLIDLAVHDYLNLKANLLIGSQSSIPPGVSITSAAAIHAVCPGQISERSIQRSLQHLEKIGWIKRWNVNGKHGNYPVLVCRASVHDLSGKEYRINGEETTDWRFPKWLRVGEASASSEIADTLVSGDREKRVESREEKKHSAPPDFTLHRSLAEQETKRDFFENVFWAEWPEKQNKAAARKAWRKVPVGEYPSVMTGLKRWRQSVQWARRIIPHAATWLNQKRWQDEDIPQQQFSGGSDAGPQGRRPSRGDNFRATLEAAYGQSPVN